MEWYEWDAGGRLQYLDSGILKLLAAVTMVIDHIGLVLFPQMQILRIIGRLSFPIYCFLLAEGARHTGSIRRYAGRLLIFALISELPFDRALWGAAYDLNHQNVFFTLFLGLAVIAFWQDPPVRTRTLQGMQLEECLILAAACLLAHLLRTDYSATGVLVIAAFYRFRQRPLLKFLVTGCLLISMGNIEPYAVIAFVPILLSSGRQSLASRPWKLAFYALYPVHLSVLWICRLILRT